MISRNLPSSEILGFQRALQNMWLWLVSDTSNFNFVRQQPPGSWAWVPVSSLRCAWTKIPSAVLRPIAIAVGMMRPYAGPTYLFGPQEKTRKVSQMFHLWNIYPQNWVIFGKNASKSSIEHLCFVWNTRPRTKFRQTATSSAADCPRSCDSFSGFASRCLGGRWAEGEGTCCRVLYGEGSDLRIPTI